MSLIFLPTSTLRMTLRHPLLRRPCGQRKNSPRGPRSSSSSPKYEPHTTEKPSSAPSHPSPPTPLATQKSLAPVPSTVSQASSTTTYPSIPGSSWVWLQVQPLTYPFRAYNRIQSRRPYVVQLCSSSIIYFLGDLTSQYIQNRTLAPPPTSMNSTITSETPDAALSTGDDDSTKPSTAYDPSRALRSVTIGFLSSIPSYHYFLLLSRSFNLVGRPSISLSLKVIVNQLTFAPLFNCYFFGMHALLASLSTNPSEALGAGFSRIKETVPQSWVASCKFWPVVTAFSFTFVPAQHRSVFAGVVAIGWQTYLNLLNQRAIRIERERALDEAGKSGAALE